LSASFRVYHSLDEEV